MSEHVCPWWLGYWLASPLRKLYQHPERILSPYIRPGMTILDIGPAMGFFTLPLAKMVGDQGKVIAIDVQQKMLDALVKRAAKAGLGNRIQPKLCSSNLLELALFTGQIDFALAFAVLHEMPDAGRAMAEVFAALKPGGRLFIAEPRGHVNPVEFEQTIVQVAASGFTRESTPPVNGSHTALMLKPVG